MECCYWSLLQLGCDVLSQGDAWFIICAVRTDLVEGLPGKMSNLARTLLKTLLFTPRGHNLASGIFISL